MKKTIKNLYAVGIGLLLLTNACKKNELPATASEHTVAATQQKAVRANSSNRSADGQSVGDPNAIVDISLPLFNALRSGNLIQMQQVSPGLYNGTNIITMPVGGSDDDPCEAAWAAYRAFMAANMAKFQAWANANCKPYRGAWGYPEPCAMCVLFEVVPTSYWNCPQEAFEYNQHLPLHAYQE